MRAWLIGRAILAGIVRVAEGVGPRGEIYAGAAAGAVLGAAGFASSLLVWTKQRRQQAMEKEGLTPPSRYDPLTWWLIGLLARGTLLALFSAGFWKVLGAQANAALYALAGVYLLLHLWDTTWLYRKFTRKTEE